MCHTVCTTPDVHTRENLKRETALLSAIGRFLLDILFTLPPLLPRFAVAWVITLVFLVLLFSSAKRRVRNEVKHFDERLRAWASMLRYRAEKNMTSEEQREERIALSWFFRFWTNFASAPSLSFWSLAIPFALLYRNGFNEGARLHEVAAWLLPGLCYAGSMLLSFVIKRVFKRVRPPRPGKAFGYRLKDPSFPSGHSLTSFCFWTMFTLVLVQSTVFSGIGMILLALVALSIVALTGLSRIYLGVHFPSDVVGGYTIGAVWCVACYLALNPILEPVLRRIS